MNRWSWAYITCRPYKCASEQRDCWIKLWFEHEDKNELIKNELHKCLTPFFQWMKVIKLQEHNNNKKKKTANNSSALHSAILAISISEKLTESENMAESSRTWQVACGTQNWIQLVRWFRLTSSSLTPSGVSGDTHYRQMETSDFMLCNTFNRQLLRGGRQL